MSISADTAKLTAAAEIIHRVAHGADTETVATESGPCPTLAKRLKDLELSPPDIAAIAEETIGATVTGNAIIRAADAAAAQTAIGATVTGKALMTATDAAAAQAAIGATVVGKALIVAANADAAQTAIGATATGKAVIAATDAAAARSAIGLSAISATGSGADLTDATVTNAKLAQVATATFKGRSTDGTGDVEDMTAAQAAAILSQAMFVSNRNRIINGCFRKWDYAASQTASGYGSANRWECGHSGSTKTASRQAFTVGQTDVPGEPAYFMRHAVTSSAGASNYCKMQQAIESVRSFAGKTIRVSFYAKADASCNMALELVQSFGSGGSPSSDITGIGSQLVALTTSWVKKSITISVPSILGKTLGTTDDGYLQLVNWFDAGSSFNARTASLGQQSRTIDIARVRICEGSVDCDNDPDVDIETLTRQCERFYEKSYDDGTAVGTATGVASITAGLSSATTTQTFPLRYRTKKRAAPIVTLYSSGSGAPGQIRDTTGSVDVAGTADSSGTSGCRVYWASTADRSYAFHYAAQAEL